MPVRSAKREEPGAIWKAIDVTIRQEQYRVHVNFSIRLFWNESSSFALLRRANDRKLSQQLIDAFMPGLEPRASESGLSPMDFYDAVYTPAEVDALPQDIVIPGLAATLFPFQTRTLGWLLAREGVKWSVDDAKLVPSSPPNGSCWTDSFRLSRDAEGGDVFVSDLFQAVTRDPRSLQRANTFVRGGILAEEMGLGKTLELLGLILLHKRSDTPPTTASSEEVKLDRSGATLIVAPASLRAQWISEIHRHAPNLRIKLYTGCKGLQAGEIEDLVHELSGYDVVISTYHMLSTELHFAMEPPQRSRRFKREYPRPTSPLVKISWWRLCLDEAQMIENGYSQAAIVARSIPRVNAWAVSGTPVKNDIQDLFGLLSFLRYEPYCYAPQIWQTLVRQHKPIFRSIFRSIALRHTKAMVRDEILLPAQRRYVIGMPFTAVEEQHYQSLFREMAAECQLDIHGAPLTDDWHPSQCEEVMRVWLNRLRQTTLHPEVGSFNRRALGTGRSRPMRTVEEVLDAMLEQSENAIRNDERAYLSIRLTHGQLYENSPRVREALAIWEEVRAETQKAVDSARKRLVDVAREQGKEKGCNKSYVDDSVTDSSDSEVGTEQVDARDRLGDHPRRLRSALELHHRALFFCANAYFQIRENAEMTKPESEEYVRLKKLEDEGYEEAKKVRREILHESNKKAARLMRRLARKASKQTFTEIPDLSIRPQRGIETSSVVDKLAGLYAKLNAQAAVLDEWREQVIQLLLRPLVDEDDDVETTGEELMDSAKFQDLLMVYYHALRAAIADRQDAITGQTNELVKHETETSIRIAKEGEGPAPDKLLELLEKRRTMKPKAGHLSMRGAISELRSLHSQLGRGSSGSAREATESQIAAIQLQATQTQLHAHSKIAMSLESEIESFKVAMNTRLEYYRQLQAVSDAALPYEGAKSEVVLARMVQTEEDLRRKLSIAEAKHRYLLHLKESGSKSNEPRMCVICQLPFITGVLTVCGHQFCKKCMTLWFEAHHNCPVCKRSLKLANLHDITIKPQQLQMKSEELHPTLAKEPSRCSPVPRASSGPVQAVIYKAFSAEKLAEIKNVELEGPSFTTKVDTLVRHLMWLREADPGAKSIVFSQFTEFLAVLRTAFRRYRIGHASITDAEGITKFKEDPAIEVFLLHARAHASGLNLVNASHVFLCEPLLNTALELQAIARVDRIGQMHETTVWLYVVNGTVEESIHNLSIKRRTEHMGGRQGGGAKTATKAEAGNATPGLLDARIEEANTLELEHAALSKLMSKDKSAGEVVDKGDLWECLFGHVASNHDVDVPSADASRLREKAVMSYMAGEAAERRREGSS